MSLSLLFIYDARRTTAVKMCVCLCDEYNGHFVVCVAVVVILLLAIYYQ